MKDQSLVARARQIIETTDGDITEREALRRAIAERFGDDINGLLDFAAGGAVTQMRSAAHIARNIPDPDQMSLDGVIPTHFPTAESDGTLWRDRRNPETQGRHAKQFARDVERYGKQLAARGARLVTITGQLTDDDPLEDQIKALGSARRTPREVTE